MADGDKAKGDSAAPEGVSQFVTKVLDQLSLSAWLPAAMLIGVGALLLEFHGQRKLDLQKAVTDLTAKPLGILIVLLFAVVLVTMITQAFELTAIRLLEGYWPPILSTVGVTATLVHLQSLRRRLTAWWLLYTRKRAFKTARDKMFDDQVDGDVIVFFTKVVNRQSTKETSAAVRANARAIGWERYAPASKLRAVEARERSLARYPDRHRLMPTRLGNVLRAGEDELVNTDRQPLRQFVIRHWSLLSSELRATHDQYRVRLDMYCALVFVALMIGAGSPAILIDGYGHDTAAIVACGSSIILMLVFYRAAITAAQGYVGVLHAIDSVVTKSRAADVNPPSSSPPTPGP